MVKWPQSAQTRRAWAKGPMATAATAPSPT
jgi:hypothetical protein